MRETLRRVLIEFWFPALIASMWTAYSVPTTLTGAVNTWGLTFISVAWITGQLFRIRKQARVEKDLGSIETRLAGLVGKLEDQTKEVLSHLDQELAAGHEEILRSIAELKKTQTRLPQVEPPRPPYIYEGRLLDEARTLVEGGYVFAGLLTAGLAFEQAVRHRARRLGVDAADELPVAQLLRILQRSFNRGTSEELRALWKLRSQIVHATPDAARELASQPELIKYFESAIDSLTRERDGDGTSGDTDAVRPRM